ncbi:MAG: tripartite tricarboxylate transporter substrate binding protein [Betaproteobacteria bacterium]|nr:tripartite tricarboxylate transporter substrate binding protein [Betaproteobacteria bacterium]MBI2290423.1 tripartite tricarboxylate transporter substrate binding protein [Betaproteobacteria bacterium]MBI3054977.1 tripartite tricarboxylate transporter substrate binding protein [Betaproteobacteria bacterium]
MKSILRVMTLGALVWLTMPAGDGFGQAYPTKAVSMVVPFPPGGRTDLTARVVAQYLPKHLGQPVVVVNKPGAGGVLGAKEVAAATPDGYTLGFFSTAVVTAQYTVPTPTDLKDYAAVSIVNVDPAALAVKFDAPWKTLAELADYGRKNPGKVQIGMIPGASAQIFAGGFAKAARMQAVYVPFKGDADGVVALAGGHIDAHVAVPVSYKALAEARKVRILGVAADARSALYQGIPTFKENSVDLVIGSFHAVFAPKAASGDILAALAGALEKTMKEPELNAKMSAAGLGVVYLNRQDTAAFIAQQDGTYKSLIKDLGMMVKK